MPKSVAFYTDCGAEMEPRGPQAVGVDRRPRCRWTGHQAC